MGSEQSSVSASSIPLQRVVTPTPEDHVVPTFETVQEQDVKPEPAVVPVSMSPAASSIFTSTQEGASEADYDDVWDGYESPPPKDAHIAARRDERRYRLLLQHSFHPTCKTRLVLSPNYFLSQKRLLLTVNLPLWEPSPVRLGAVGYLSKPSGRFVTLFNSFNPSGASDRRVHGMPSIYGYGAVRETAMRLDRRNIAQIGFDIIQGLLTFKKSGAGDSTFS